jgi:hypothetical protein
MGKLKLSRLNRYFKLSPKTIAGIGDCLFVTIKFKESEKFGIAWTDLKKRNWSLLSVAFDQSIEKINRFGMELIILMNKPIGKKIPKRNQSEYDVYKIQLW